MSTRAKALTTASKTSTTATKPAPAHAVATPAPAPAPTAAPPPFIAPPPAGAAIPSVPDGFVPTNGASYTGTKPQKAELVALPLAILDLGKFTSYPSVIGGTAPPLPEVLQTFDVTHDWSSMRNASSAWDEYCREQEGIAWRVMRALLDRLKPAFALAAQTNPSLATTYAGLAALLGAKKVAAAKSVATKKRNKLEVAAGKAPTHGQVGKKHQKAAARAALAAQNAKGGPQVIAPVEATPVALAPSAPAPTTQAPVASAPAVATNGAPAGSNGTPRS